MSIMRILILVVAAAAALIAAMLVRNMSSQPEPTEIETVEAAPVQPALPLTKILIASGDLQLGHRLAPEDFTWQNWPDEAIDDRYMTEETAPDATTDLAGAVVRMPIYSGEPILAQKIIQVGERSIMSGVLDEGMRAVAVEISVDTAAGGFILPNDRVDVILSYKVEVTEGDIVVERPATRTILENVRVLAIDQAIREVEGENVVVGSSATLELKPAHAEILMLGTQMGDLSLTLRSVSDAVSAGTIVKAAQGIESAKDISGSVRIYRNGVVEKATVGGNP